MTPYSPFSPIYLFKSSYIIIIIDISKSPTSSDEFDVKNEPRDGSDPSGDDSRSGSSSSLTAEEGEES